MTWVRLEDSFPEHPKILGLSVAAKWLIVEGLCWCNRNLTDGFIAAEAAPRLGATKKLAGELVEAGVWELCDGGWMVHDYDEFQPSRERVLADREAGRLRKAKHDAKKRSGKQAGNDAGNGVTDPVTHGHPVPGPDPTTSSSSVTTSNAPPDRDDDDGLASELIDAVVTLKVAGQNPTNPGPYRATVARNVPVEHGDDLRRTLEEHPAWPTNWIAAHALGQPRTDPTPRQVIDSCPDCTNGLVETDAGMAPCPSCSWARNGNRTGAVT
ncbi:MAG: hypothetical protein KA755_01620 [Candidatus Microthrix sp.]|nr:hypothetical protein [Candidatus Microthrix sp.]